MNKVFLPTILVIVILYLLPSTGYAQDIHFSQFYAMPVNLNPAYTGFSEGDYRLAAIYRNQWAGVTQPYVTYGGSFDMRLLKEKLKKDVFGVGALVTNDESGDGSLSNLSIQASAAYHKMLGEKGKNYLGLGIQLGYVQRSLDMMNLTFPTQHVDGGFDLNLPSMENLNDPNTGFFDMSVGLFWNGQIKERAGLFAGANFSHLTQPKESFLDQDVALAMRYTVHAGSRVKLAERWYLTPNVLFMYQNKARQINFGTAIEYYVKTGNDPVVLSLGGWYRVSDAGIISAGTEFKRIRLGLSYDLTTSDFTSVPSDINNHSGSFEISLIYIGKRPETDIGPILVPCPRL